MNNKIKEIAMTVQRERHWTEEDIEKFAELIIRECTASIRALDNDAPYDEWTSGYTSAIVSAAEAVKERFDIKG